jgi:hypothetical protein
MTTISLLLLFSKAAIAIKKFHGFNLGDKNECDAAFEILEDEDDFTVIGWKVARNNPKWVNVAEKWNMRNKLEDINHDGEDNDVNEKDDDDDAMNVKELEEDKQEANHEEEVDIYDEDNKNDHEYVEMVEEEEDQNNYKMKKDSHVSKTASSAKKGAIIQSSDDAHKSDLLNTTVAGNLKKTISENVAKAVKPNSMDVHITGPISNKKWQKSLGCGVW